MTTLNLSSKDPARLAADALVIGVRSAGGSATVEGADFLSRSAAESVSRAITLLGVTGDTGQITKIPAGDAVKADLLVLVGLGKTVEDEDGRRERLRRAAGSATAALAGTAKVVLALPTDGAQDVGAVAEGALLGSYVYDRPGTDKDSIKAPVGAVEIAAGARSKGLKAALTRAEVTAAAVHAARDLVNTSPNLLYPASFAERAAKAVKGTKVSIKVLDEKQLRDGGYGGITGVGQGSARPPRLVRLSYSPARAKRTVALVGKGITFDSGGLSLKPPKSMETMKSDMAGAAAVLHTVIAAAALELPVAVTGWLALAENLPSATAQRPSDVITIRGGKTVEVLNTDAEGRLVLADALVAAGEEKPDLLVDIATLTGAQMVALGSQVGAVMGTDAERTAVAEAASRAGEQFWPMPLPEELRASLNTPTADLANIGERMGGMLVAGLFLKEFTGGLPWAHLDIAGPAFNEGGARHYVPKGGTGMGVRTLVELLCAVGA
ncbi:leucyl aminopeptidase [Ruania albidiflava]|uniref:leucyl aminopeptidase n=1 Tax=Ruania albidiflava TaxID=366586 RepID=UPI0023F2DC88|nr:leucyl aminopeptidase [Ruania albidiflava]